MNNGRHNRTYLIKLISLREPMGLMDSFRIRAASMGEAFSLAYKTLKTRPVYKNNDDVRDFVMLYEADPDFSSAGHEFDVLPEALRSLYLEITEV